ncbi:unnamed protein product [Calypogeia fissa]
MSLGAGERVGARLLQQRPFSSASSSSSASFSRHAVSSSVTSWTGSHRIASVADHNQTSATEDSKEDPTSLSKTKEEHVDKALMRFLVGKGGSMKAKLEKDNGVKLSIPSSHDARSRSSIFINGSESSIKAASSAIQKILDDAVQSKLQYTHFISLPMTLHPALVEQVENFQRSSLGLSQISPPDAESSSGSQEDSDSTNIHKSIFINPRTIHFTILMLKLWNEERVQAAVDVLQKIMPFVHEALEEQPIVVDLQGVECLRGTPEKAHVLYAEVKESRDKGRLLEACQVLTDAFVESGLVMERDVGQSLTLHLTLMNTTHRKKKKNEWSSKRVPFDAREILAKYGSWNWGEYPVLEAHLSQRFVYDESGYYHCVSAFPFHRHTS